MQEIVNKFTTHLKNVLTRALTFVVENGQEAVLPEHLLWALASQKGSIGAELLVKAEVKLDGVRALLLRVPRATIGNVLPVLSDEARRIVEKAVLTANTYDHRYVGTEHLLSGLLQIAPTTVMDFLHAEGIDVEHLSDEVATVLKSTSRFPDLASGVVGKEERGKRKEEVQTKDGAVTKEEQKNPALDYFCYELTSPEAQKKIDPVIGREPEIERVQQILCRRMKNNPILLGEPGVGKTAIVEGLAKRIVEGRVPPPLAGKRLYALDLSLVVAGTAYRGEFEGRLKQIVDEVQKRTDVILFIDEVHTMIGAGAATGSMDAANILKPALARGDIHCIGATTQAEYKKNFETDAALERRFCPLMVTEPDAEETLQILNGVKAQYESYHHVTIADQALNAAITLSNRYIPERHQPDKALDLIDETGSAVRLRAVKNAAPPAHLDLERRLRDLREKKRQAIIEEQFDDAAALKDEETRLLAELAKPGTKEADRHATLTDRDVAETITRMTGIPLATLVGEQHRLDTLEATLATQVIGQDMAVKAVAAAVRRAHAHISDPRRPLASFLFMGPSGVGKTELARALATEVFQDPSALVSLDMSEFVEGFSVSKLVGAPAGYVGYREPTKLTDRVKTRPYCLVLFDEIDKAHRDVHNLLLQILETGTLADATGRNVNFKNTIVVMTTNAGADKLERGDIGFNAAGEKPTLLTHDLRQELEESFRPELLNRIDHTAVFQPLGNETLALIANKLLNELTARLALERIDLNVTDDLGAHLASKANQKLGARDLRRLIQTDLENAVADFALAHSRPLSLSAKVSRGTIAVKKR